MFMKSLIWSELQFKHKVLIQAWQITTPLVILSFPEKY